MPDDAKQKEIDNKTQQVKEAKASTSKADPNSICLFGFNLPLDSLENLIGSDKSTKHDSLGSLLGDVVESLGGLGEVGKMAYCIGEMILNPEMLLRVLDNITNSITAVAFQMANDVLNCIGGQIDQALGQISGTLSRLLGGVLDFLDSVEAAFKTLKEIFSENKLKGKENLKSFMTQDDCVYMFCNIAKCLINKTVGDKVYDFEKKVTDNIIKTGQDVNMSIAKELQDTNNLSNFVEHETFMMNKANEQMALM